MHSVFFKMLINLINIYCILTLCQEIFLVIKQIVKFSCTPKTIPHLPTHSEVSYLMVLFWKSNIMKGSLEKGMTTLAYEKRNMSGRKDQMGGTMKN